MHKIQAMAEKGRATTNVHQKRSKLARNSPFLPLELIFNILSLLPATDSLLRFKCVCKSWRSLISDPVFIKTHLKLSNQNKHHSHRKFIFVSRSTLSLRTCSLQSLMFQNPETVIDTIDIDNSKHGHGSWAQVVGSCNGLVCIAGLSYTLSFWNPSTKESRKLVYNYSEGVRCSVVYGFGYDEPNDDYKLVVIYWRNHQDGAFVRVYTLKTNSWRRIQDFPYPLIPLDGSGKFVNGSLHWAARDHLGLAHWVIISLDLTTEIYSEVPQPDYGVSDFNLALGVSGDFLCVLCNFPRSHADVWVMKEYGIKESWTKLVTVPYLMDPGLTRYSVPLCASENGEILLELGDRLVVYNSTENTLKYQKIRNYDACAGVYTYVETLVSPNLVENNNSQLE